jgi:hypothetical protein
MNKGSKVKVTSGIVAALIGAAGVAWADANSVAAKGTNTRGVDPGITGEEARGQFAHSNVITVLNPAGEIVHQQIGFNQDVAATIKAISNAACKAQ